jgi:hypothetical protein
LDAKQHRYKCIGAALYRFESCPGYKNKKNMGNQIERILKNLLKPENEKIKIRSEKKSKIDKKINQLIQKKKK